MRKEVQAVPPIDPKQYQEALRGLQIKGVLLDSVEAAIHRDVLKEGDVELELSYETASHEELGSYAALITYRLCGKIENDEFIFVIAKYRVIHSTPGPVPPGFAKVFEEINLRVTTFPYMRELVASLTGRMELPTLNLPYSVLTSQKDAGESGGKPVQGRPKKKDV